MFPKQPRLTNDNLRKMAHGRECLLKMAAHCQYGSTVMAHSNFIGSGKGMGMKAHDFNSVWACATCHDALDSGHRSYEDKLESFNRAHVLQVIEWAKIANDPTEAPKNRLAAQWAIDKLKEFNVR